MDNSQIMFLITLIISLIAIITPIIKLNSTITKLDITLNNLIKRTDEDRERIVKLENKVFNKD